MSIIEVNPLFGDCIAKKEMCRVDKSGLVVKVKQIDSCCYVEDTETNLIIPLKSNGEVYPRQGIFSKNKDKNYIIYLLSKKAFYSQGFTTKMHFDSNYNNVSVDINIPYDISFKVDSSQIPSFIRYAFSLYSGVTIDYELIYNSLAPYINTAIKKSIGNSGIYTIEDLETAVELLNRDVKNEINIMMTNYGYGIQITNVNLQIIDDYEHRQEKKRVEHNKVLNGGF